MTTITATRRFRLKILACMLKTRWMAKYGPIIKPEYFEKKDETDLAEVLMEHWKIYRQPPEDPDDVIAVLGDKYKVIIGTVFLGADDWDLTFASDYVLQFAKEQAAKIAVLESLNDIERGDLATMLERITEANKVGEDIGNLGIDLKKDIKTWLHDAQSRKIPTGLIHLDIAMEGGLAKGELGVILAPPNYGKSMMLINIGHGAMGPISRCNVVHFTLEMAESVVAKRYGARSIFRFPNRTGSTTKYEKEFAEYAEIMLPGNVRILHIAGNINTLRAKLNTLRDSGYEIDMIIVDYGDLVDSVRQRDNLYTELGDVFKALRGLGAIDEFDCPIWTATQTNRSAMRKEVVTMEDLADSFRKAAIADSIVAICMTQEEEDNEECRIFLAKLRDSKSRSLIKAKYYKSEQAIITTGFVGRN